jgi:hypothetical protein
MTIWEPHEAGAAEAFPGKPCVDSCDSPKTLWLGKDATKQLLPELRLV